MNSLKVGFGRVVTTPMMGIPIAGYFIDRFADGVLDDLEANAVCVEAGGNKAVMISVDHCGLVKEILDPIRRKIAEKTGIPYEGVYIHSTHTHTGPILQPDKCDNELIARYREFMTDRLTDVAAFAMEDLKPAKMGTGVGTAPHIAFIRRYVMKDGSVRTNPGVNNPEIDHMLGSVDERVNVIRFDREGADTVVIVNFGDHPDTVGGNKISGDWPGFLRRTVEKALDNTKCIFLNGAQGDVNHVNVAPAGGDLNDMFMDFDDVSRGYGHARHMGRVVAGAVLSVFDKVEYRDVDTVKFLQNDLEIPSNMPNEKDDFDLATAHKYADLHTSGRDCDIPYKGMMLTTVCAEALRMCNLEHGPASFPTYITGLRIGDVAFVGIPGEPFTGIGTALKETEGWKMVCPTCNTNAKEGYFPMKDCYDEGGYEARGSKFKEGVAEFMIENGKKVLDQLK
ncbi:MAG: hypothetical protein KBS39_00665 [Lachnospiraceae bacterium]|nr:hypothetical protein [Candidatus Hippenecus merdae]